jgi:hypothetical protein
VFHMDIAKIDHDVAHVAMVVHVCCKRLFQIFHLFFQTYAASVLIWMLHMFHTYMLQEYVRNVFNCFILMLQ